MNNFLTLMVVLFFSISAYASDNTKVNLNKTNKIQYYNLHIDSTRTVVLKGVVRDTNIEEIKNKIIELKEIDKKAPIFIILNTPGGSVVSGFELITLIKSVDLQVICVIESEAFSMGALISQYCSETYIHKYASLMFHEPRYSIRGSASIISTRVKYMNEYIEVLYKDVASQMGISYESYRDLIQSEWWVTAKEAARFGLVDGIVDTLYYTATPPQEKFFFFSFENDESGNIVKHPAK